MAIKFVLMVNKQGQTRLASYYDWMSIDERTALEAEIIRKCLSRTENQCSFMEYRGMRIVYRRYASLFFIVGVEQDEEVRTLGQPRRPKDHRVWSFERRFFKSHVHMAFFFLVLELSRLLARRVGSRHMSTNRADVNARLSAVLAIYFAE